MVTPPYKINDIRHMVYLRRVINDVIVTEIDHVVNVGLLERQTHSQISNIRSYVVAYDVDLFCSFDLLLYVNYKQLWSCRDGQYPCHIFPGQA